MSRNVQPVVAGVWPTDSVRDIAEQQGVANLSDDFVNALANDVEYRLHEIIEEAAKFMRHARRTKLKVEDVEYALKARNMEPIWGFSAPNALSFRKTQTPTGTLYFYDDEEIDLTRIYKTQLPPVPRDVSYTAHWLAVEGVQPAVPQNPSAAEMQAIAQPRASTSAATQTGGVDVRPLVKHVLSRELQLYFDRVTAASVDPSVEMRLAALDSLREDTGLGSLVPYLVQWISERVVATLSTSLTDIEHMISFIKAMLDNRTLFIEPYLHQLLPPILSILLTVDLAPSTTSLTQIEIRSAAAQILRQILKDYAHAYLSLQPRILKTLIRGLTGEGDRYGAISGIGALGREAVLMTIARPANLRSIDTALAEVDEGSRAALVDLVGDTLQQHVPPPTAEHPPSLDTFDASDHWGPTMAAEIEKRGLTRAMLEAEQDADVHGITIEQVNGRTTSRDASTQPVAMDEMQ